MLFTRSFIIPICLLGAMAACALAPRASADVFSANASGNATVQPAGPRTGTNGLGSFNVEANTNGTNASFGVLDFSRDAFNLNGQVSGITNNTLTLQLTESNAAFTLAGGILNFYLTEDTTTSISNTAGASPLKYNSSAAPEGVGTQLGFGTATVFSLGSYTFTGTKTPTDTSGTVDTITLTLSANAQTYFVNQLNTAGSTLRLVVTPENGSGAGTDTAKYAATYSGATSTATNKNGTSAKPTLSFDAAISLGTALTWQGGSGAWNPGGDTAWSGGPWVNDGAHSAIFSVSGGGTVNVNGQILASTLQFNTTGYTIGAADAASTLALQNSASVIVTNAADTATITAPLVGSLGLIKSGAGTLVLGGANTYTGATTLSAGTLRVSDDSQLGAASNGIALNGGTLAVNASTALGGGRALSGAGSLSVPSGQTLSVHGDVNLTGALVLPDAGTVALVSDSQRGYETIPALTFNSAGTLTSAGSPNLSAITASQTSGTATLSSANIYLSGAASINVNVPNAAATLVINGSIISGSFNNNGFIAKTITLVKLGSGTLDLTGDNSQILGAGTTPGSMRQGVAGASPADGGTLIVHTNTGLGNSQYQFNSGTFVNASGSPLVFVNGLSIGGGQLAGGATFSGASGSSSEFQGQVSLFNPTGVVYQHIITVKAPTTFSGEFAAGTGSNNGLLITGGSSLTLAFSGGNTFTDNVTVGGSSLILTQNGAMSANSFLTLQSSALLRLSTGATSGTVDALNNSLFLAVSSDSHVDLNIGTASEEIGGLQLGNAVQPAGVYGPIGSGAPNETAFLTGSGFILNDGTAVPVPEPGAWLMSLVGGCGLLAWRRLGKARAHRGAGC